MSWMIVLFQWMSQLLNGSKEDRDIKHSMVVCSGSNKTATLLNHLKSLLCYVMFMLCYAMLCYVYVHVILCNVILCYVMLWYTMPCYVYAMSCHVISCHVMSCYV